MDEFQFCTPSTKAAILFIRSLSDAVLLEATRVGTAGYQSVLIEMGPDTNHSWITGQTAEEAYRRGLISEREFDYLSD